MGSGEGIKAFYYDKGNFGDILTPLLVRKIFHRPILHTQYIANANFVGIGSVLEKLEERTRDQQLTIWGAGYMYDGDKQVYPNIDFLAVRGKLSANRISGFHGVIGDPGLLVSKIAPKTEKIYEIGFIPHYIDRFTDLSRRISKLPDVHYIDIMQNPKTFLEEVSRCKRVVSSSLHGIVTADSLEIPNLHIMLSKKVYGKNYKFRDYYSAFNMDHRYSDFQVYRQNPRILTTDRIIATIDQNYRKPTNLEELQNGLIEAFERKYA